MSVSYFKINLTYINLATFLFCGCNLDYAPSFTSASIAASKDKGFFLFEYKVDSLKNLDNNKPFGVRHAWLEKSHTSTMDFFGKEKFQTLEGMNQIVFDLDKNSFTKKSLNWLIEDEKGDLDGESGGMISINLNHKVVPERIRIIVDTLKSPRIINYGRVMVAEFTLEKP